MATDNLLANQVMQALARGDKLAAVKLVREAGIGSLRDAMRLVEAQAAGHGPEAKDGLQRITQGIADARDRHGVQGHARAAQAALRAHGRTPTVVMGDAPGSLRWVMIALFLVALAVWLGLGG